MKKLLIILLALVMAFSFAACGGGGGSDDDGGEEGKIDTDKVIEDAFKNAEDFESFSQEAVDYFFYKAAGLRITDVEPDWEWTLAHDYSAYADDPDSGYGHGVIKFTKVEGEMVDGEYEAWLQKVFDATAKASQDGYNIHGHEFAGEGEDPASEITLEESMEGFLQGWCFRYNDKSMAVYVEQDYDNDKDSAYGKLFYYDGVQVDIGVGMQMSWDEYDQYIEDNMDEIEDALEDYVN